MATGDLPSEHDESPAGGEAAPSSTPAPSSPSMHEGEIVQEISLEEFNPVGTLALNGLYFLLLLTLYALMYFVEFAGRGPSIID